MIFTELIGSDKFLVHHKKSDDLIKSPYIFFWQVFQKCIKFKKYLDDMNNLLEKEYDGEKVKVEPVERKVKK